MKVLIIPEDQTLDSFIVKPVIDAILSDIGIRAQVSVLPEPRLRGAGDALDPDVIGNIVQDNPMMDLFILVVDRDCDRKGHEAKAAARENEHRSHLIACVAVQEIEVWMLALHKQRLDARWQEVRAECDPKEKWAEPLLTELGTCGPGRGRKRAMSALRGQIRSLLVLCDELQVLKDKIEHFRQQSLRSSGP